jgi:hypothetical protein
VQAGAAGRAALIVAGEVVSWAKAMQRDARVGQRLRVTVDLCRIR